MDINQKEQALIRELMEKYPVVMQAGPASPEYLYADNLELYAKMYIEQHPGMDKETASREILSYAEKAKENDISVLPPKGNLQKDGLYFSHGELVLPGLAAMKDHHLVSYSEDVQKAYDELPHPCLVNVHWTFPSVWIWYLYRVANSLSGSGWSRPRIRAGSRSLYRGYQPLTLYNASNRTTFRFLRTDAIS